MCDTAFHLLLINFKSSAASYDKDRAFLFDKEYGASLFLANTKKTLVSYHKSK